MGLPAGDCGGFDLYCGTASRVYPTTVDVGNATTYTLAGLAEGGTYYCAVTAYDAARLESDYSTELPVSVPYRAPVANFTMTPTSGTAPLTVALHQHLRGVTSWSWDFGDGTTSTAKNPTHVYSAGQLHRQAHGHRPGRQPH